MEFGIQIVAFQTTYLLVKYATTDVTHVYVNEFVHVRGNRLAIDMCNQRT